MTGIGGTMSIKKTSLELEQDGYPFYFRLIENELPPPKSEVASDAQ